MFNAIKFARFRNEKLTKLNLALREQLEESQQTNESLTNDLQKLAADWQQMRDEMLEKEEEWKEEEQVIADNNSLEIILPYFATRLNCTE